VNVLAKTYVVHIRGEVARDALEDLDELDFITATVVPTETVLTGKVPDQAALLGLLNRIHSLGLEVVEVRRAPEEFGGT
jgi:hypothetical protein